MKPEDTELWNVLSVCLLEVEAAFKGWSVERKQERAAWWVARKGKREVFAPSFASMFVCVVHYNRRSSGERRAAEDPRDFASRNVLSVSDRIEEVCRGWGLSRSRRSGEWYGMYYTGSRSCSAPTTFKHLIGLLMAIHPKRGR